MSQEKAQPDLAKAEAKALIAIAPALAGLTVSETQLPGVTTYLTIGLRIASSIGATPAENAPVFKA
jgi:hypothetical protein